MNKFINESTMVYMWGACVVLSAMAVSAAFTILITTGFLGLSVAFLGIGSLGFSLVKFVTTAENRRIDRKVEKYMYKITGIEPEMSYKKKLKYLENSRRKIKRELVGNIGYSSLEADSCRKLISIEKKIGEHTGLGYDESLYRDQY